MEYLRVYADAEGESHFDEVEVKMSSRELVAGYPPLQFSDDISVDHISMVHLPPGLPDTVDRHPAPGRAFLNYLSGQTEIEVSDGEKRVVGPNDLLFVEDTHGKGHISRILGDEGQTVIFMWLADENGS